MKIFDAFLFCHELDLLEARMRMLYDYVDFFVIQESPKTHMAKDKKLYFRDNRNRFAWADKKIIHIICEEFKPVVDTDGRVHDFLNEKFQRNYLYDRLKEVADDEDIIFFSDIDEIPHRDTYVSARKNELKLPLTVEHDLYIFNIKNRLEKKWLGTRIMKKTDESGDFMRLDRTGSGFHSGWHFTYFMSPEDISFKLRSFAHAQTYGVGEWQDEKRIEEHRKNGTNLLKKNIRKAPPKELPVYVMDILKDYPLFMGLK